MTNGCWNCKKFHEHFYWEHMEAIRCHFLKVMEGDFFHVMEFPRKFARNFRVELPGLITLETPKGKLLKISLLKDDDRFYFKDGWKEFIHDHGIKEGYSLFFKYAGNASFTVQIFDQSGCLRGNSNLSKSTKKRLGEEAQILKRSQTYTVKVSTNSRLDHDNDQLLSKISDANSSGENGSSDGVIHCKKRKLRGEDVYSKTDWDGFIQKKFNGISWSGRKRRMKISAHLSKVLQHFFPNEEGKSSFVKVMLKSYLNEHPFMVIPSEFVSDHLHKKPENIVCKQNGKQWVIGCKSSSSSFGFRGKSLLQFVQDNNLKEGDACIFRLMGTSREVIMDVIIVRAAEIFSILNL